MQSLCCTKKPNRSSFRTVVLALPLLASLLTMSSAKSSDVAQHYFDAQHYSVSERIRGVLDHHIQSTVSCKGVPDGQHADSIIVGPYSRFHNWGLSSGTVFLRKCYLRPSILLICFTFVAAQATLPIPDEAISGSRSWWSLLSSWTKGIATDLLYKYFVAGRKSQESNLEEHSAVSSSFSVVVAIFSVLIVLALCVWRRCRSFGKNTSPTTTVNVTIGRESRPKISEEEVDELRENIALKNSTIFALKNRIKLLEQEVRDARELQQVSDRRRTELLQRVLELETAATPSLHTNPFAEESPSSHSGSLPSSDGQDQTIFSRPPPLPGTEERVRRLQQAYVLQQESDEAEMLRDELAERHRTMTAVLRPLGDYTAEIHHAERRAEQTAEEVQEHLSAIRLSQVSASLLSTLRRRRPSSAASRSGSSSPRNRVVINRVMRSQDELSDLVNFTSPSRSYSSSGPLYANRVDSDSVRISPAQSGGNISLNFEMQPPPPSPPGLGYRYRRSVPSLRICAPTGCIDPYCTLEHTAPQSTWSQEHIHGKPRRPLAEQQKDFLKAEPSKSSKPNVACEFFELSPRAYGRTTVTTVVQQPVVTATKTGSDRQSERTRSQAGPGRTGAGEQAGKAKSSVKSGRPSGRREDVEVFCCQCGEPVSSRWRCSLENQIGQVCGHAMCKDCRDEWEYAGLDPHFCACHVELPDEDPGLPEGSEHSRTVSQSSRPSNANRDEPQPRGLRPDRRFRRGPGDSDPGEDPDSEGDDDDDDDDDGERGSSAANGSGRSVRRRGAGSDRALLAQLVENNGRITDLLSREPRGGTNLRHATTLPAPKGSEKHLKDISKWLDEFKRTCKHLSGGRTPYILDVITWLVTAWDEDGNVGTSLRTVQDTDEYKHFERLEEHNQCLVLLIQKLFEFEIPEAIQQREAEEKWKGFKMNDGETIEAYHTRWENMMIELRKHNCEPDLNTLRRRYLDTINVDCTKFLELQGGSHSSPCEGQEGGS